MGLTLGISMLSIVEPIYFFTIRLFFRGNSSTLTTVDDIKSKKHAEIKPTKIMVKPAQVATSNQQLSVTRRIPREWITN